ncbi:gliding motility-associated C-terminal domain [Bergeyella zoohelcum]|uniref:Gliding motility-associated C-terminal domain n=2 Tax=Bergeyella zoohelcum TaxID=1015 RepID=A0A7Z9CG00_9FLAO|nr:gliding motility-associated C-terminal domain [Bergeyella zoohelcum]
MISMKTNFFTILFLAFCVLYNAQLQRNPETKKPQQISMARAGNFIDVNAAQYPESAYTIEQLIQNVLISGGGCAGTVSNVIVSPNLQASNSNRSWGYFNKSTSPFPFDEGLVLATGNLMNIANSAYGIPLSTTLGTGGDTDLATALSINANRFTDATYIQFDFVPNSNTVSFEYIFASEEYSGNFACNYTDGFALLLKKITDPNYTNLAVLPNNGGPVSVSNIHHHISSTCPAVNAQYFHGLNTANVETNFAGRTIPLIATASVDPGETYRFKMVLADYQDSQYDTAVFLKGGSFNLGLQLVDSSGTALPSTIELCEGESQVLTANLAISGVTYQWFLNGNPIPGATTNTYTATQSGVYKLEIQTGNNSCNESVEITVNVLPAPQVNNANISVCTVGNQAVFDLTSVQNTISTTPNTTFQFYQNQTDAIAGNANTIANPNAYTSVSGTVYARVSVGQCYAIATITLTANPTPPTPVITASATNICGTGTVTLTSSVTQGIVWSTGETTPSITVNTGGVYSVTATQNGCSSSSADITITHDPDPALQITGNLSICTGNDTTLTAVGNGNFVSYLWSNGATTPTITVNTTGTYTVTVTTANGCQFQASATVTIGTAPVVTAHQVDVCSPNGTHSFDLTTYEPNISTATGIAFTYYENQADAMAGNANTIANPTAYTTGTRTVFVRVSDGNCFAIAELTLNIKPIPTPQIQQSAAVICGTTPVTLTSNYPTGNLWSNGATSSSITVNTPRTYTLTVTENGCTSTPVSVTIAQELNPNLNITGNLSLCQGSTTTLTADTTGAINSYLWSNGATTPTITVNTAGTYTVTVTTANGCQFEASATVIITNAPTVAPHQVDVCSPNGMHAFDLTTYEPNISTTAGVVFTYYENQADAMAGNANTIANPTAYTTGTRIVYVRVSDGSCFAIAELTLNVQLIPTPQIQQSAPAICGTAPVTLTSNYPTGNLWSNGATSPSITVNTPGTYTLTVTQNGCTSTPTSVTIVQENDPNLSITGNLTFCQGSTTTLTANTTGTVNTYNWSNGATTQSITVNTGGNYSVTVTTPAGCQYTQTVQVVRESVAAITIANPAQLNCAVNAVPIHATVTNMPTGATIVWTASPGGNIVSGANTLNPIVNQPGTYTLTITNPSGLQCAVSRSVTVLRDTSAPGIILMANKTVICEGESVDLVATGAVTYTWNGLPGSGAIQTVSPTTTTTYTVTGVGANGCQGNVATVTIIVRPNITSPLTDVEFCKGEKYILDAGTGPNYTYLWSTGATTQTTEITAEGEYWVEISNGACTKKFTITASYAEMPQPSEIHYDPKGHTLSIVMKNSALNYEYSTDGINWQSSAIFHYIQRNKAYFIYVRQKGMNCYSMTEYYTFNLQNVLTPNGDGINDVLDFSGVSKYPDFQAVIFDRYGKEVFRASQGNTVWKGKYLNAHVPTNTYWYQVTWRDPYTQKLIESTGWILVKNRE